MKHDSFSPPILNMFIQHEDDNDSNVLPINYQYYRPV